jgi:hypothetical protein
VEEKVDEVKKSPFKVGWIYFWCHYFLREFIFKYRWGNVPLKSMLVCLISYAISPLCCSQYQNWCLYLLILCFSQKQNGFV